MNILVKMYLDSLGESLELVLGELNAGLGLRNQGDDGNSRVATDDWNVDLGGVQVLGLGNESVRADNVQGGNAEDPVGVVDASLLQNFGGNGHGAVDWVGDDSNLFNSWF